MEAQDIGVVVVIQLEIPAKVVRIANTEVMPGGEKVAGTQRDVTANMP